MTGTALCSSVRVRLKRRPAGFQSAEKALKTYKKPNHWRSALLFFAGICYSEISKGVPDFFGTPQTEEVRFFADLFSLHVYGLILQYGYMAAKLLRFFVLKRVIAALAGADLDNILHIIDKHFAVADIASVQRFLHGLH